jgi:putative SOS response-associated peptidase YedK
MEHYSAAFNSILEELGLVKERYSNLMSRNEKEIPYSKEEIKELKDLQKIINSFTDTHYKRYHENGFDFLPSPIITAGAPEEFKFMNWGLVPFYMSDRTKAMTLRTSTLNCISEEMYEKPSFKDAAKNAQRCLIPVTGFYEWRWLDEKGKNKIPYFVAFKEQPIVSAAGLYSRWKDKATDQYYYSYTVLTTVANPMMEYVHNNKKRMPVFIPREYEKDWLNKNLSNDDVLALCQPFKSELMKANTISKLITTKEAETNVEEVLKLHQYEKASTDEVLSEL